MKSIEEMLSGVVDTSRMMWISQARFAGLVREVKLLKVTLEAAAERAEQMREENRKMRAEIERLNKNVL